LDDQQTAKALAQLEDGRGPAEQFVPASDGERLHQAIATKDGCVQSVVLYSLATERLFYPGTCVRIDRELVETPDHESGNDDPLGRGDGLDEGISKAGAVGGRKEQCRVEEVKGAQGERKGEATGATANVKGQRDGEDDAEQEQEGRHDARNVPHERVQTTRSTGVYGEGRDPLKSGGGEGATRRSCHSPRVRYM
jgi:hypothetical protein